MFCMLCCQQTQVGLKIFADEGKYLQVEKKIRKHFWIVVRICANEIFNQICGNVLCRTFFFFSHLSTMNIQILFVTLAGVWFTLSMIFTLKLKMLIKTTKIHRRGIIPLCQGLLRSKHKISKTTNHSRIKWKTAILWRTTTMIH